MADDGLVGLRVVRGPDWKWGDQDYGEGHLGTVVEVSSKAPKKVVRVLWDHGVKASYRIGAESSYDLRIFDNATCGARHLSITCDNCKEDGIFGFRWRCTQCPNYDLCTACYMKDAHSTAHDFQRYVDTRSPPANVTPRLGAIKMDAAGIFPGAVVVRHDDPETSKKVGSVRELKNYGSDAARDAAVVVWQTGDSETCRLGHRGHVDLLCRTSASGGKYYRDHLPVLDGEKIGACNAPPVNSNSAEASSDQQLRPGDRVRIELSVEVLIGLQDGHGGWNPQIAEDVGKIGIVQEVRADGDVVVEYAPKRRWLLHPAAVMKVRPIRAGDTVIVITDQKEAKRLQNGHGGWNDMMKLSLGKTGEVIDIDSDGDVRVRVHGLTWVFNPSCLRLASEAELRSTSSNTDQDAQAAAEKVAMRLMKKSMSGRKKSGRSSTAQFQVGDAVTIITDNDKIRSLQEGHHGGYNVLMKTVLGKTGKVIHVYPDGDPRVRVRGHKWKFNPACCHLATDAEKASMDPSDPSSCDESSSEASSSDSASDDSASSASSDERTHSGLSEADLERLLKMAVGKSDREKRDKGSGSSTVFKVGDVVKILDDHSKVKKLQKGYGGWNHAMRTTLGRTGKVVLVYPTGALRVEVADHTWTFNPACCSLLTKR